ncbi:UNVERIFIED_CONTAM: hypothetical protein Scaly_2787800 [Sesamum calycinum]|uniref:BRCT domain-containing protein n=1 Tax=Sesamum calycinum TaxID=2727403 RepID=A0AAW2IZ03_9LAMI
MVVALMIGDEWKKWLVQEEFVLVDAKCILSIPLQATEEWMNHASRGWKVPFWKASLPPKVTCLLWKSGLSVEVSEDKINVRQSFIRKRGETGTWLFVVADLPSDDSGEMLLHQTIVNGSSRNDSAENDSDRMDAEASLHDTVGTSTYKQHDEKTDDETSAEGAETNSKAEASPRERCGTSSSACVTPATCTTPINNVSPICMGDEYHKQSCRKNLSRFSLIREINNLVTGSPGPHSGMKDSRKRKDITNIKVLFSQHLDVDVTKQQKRILARLGGAVASSMSDATHFVADEFVRTRNMLEAIAYGKPVVTHLWLESCGQASCLIDEKNYILRDAKKEREFGFSLPVSLSRACQHPLLQGQKVLVTPNTKPGKDILANLVKAVCGLAVERLGRSVLKDERLPDDLLILSCEEDYNICVPFLEKGGAVYSSELLLNGIVKQKLEYERHRLFADHVKRTRSTIWVKKKDQYLPVTKCNK